jgi:glycosyltransferase involved in cell wall biosynthesis
MKILALHNRYLNSGGEDYSHLAEVSLLRQAGHIVEEYIVDNSIIHQRSLVHIAFNTIWSFDSYAKIKRLLDRQRYDLLVVQNFFPLLSPSIYYAAHVSGVPVIQFLRNYRLFCLNGLALRNDQPCEACLGRQPWRGVYHACYRNSRSGSTIVAAMLMLHRVLQTWRRKVDVYVALTEFSKQKFMQAGLPEEKIFIKPNFVHPDPGVGEGGGDYVLFVGRLSAEKGVRVLIEAWQLLGIPPRLKIVGDGPLRQVVEEAARRCPEIDYLGEKSQSEVFHLLGEAKVLVFPSIVYEGMPRTMLESFSVGTPVLASERGAALEMIAPRRTGEFFKPGDVLDLAEKVQSLLSKPALLRSMREHTRREYEARYTLEQNLVYWEQLFAKVYRARLSPTS